MKLFYERIKTIGLLPIIFLTAVLSVGVFHEFVSCILSIVLSIVFCYELAHNKKFYICLNITSVSVGLIVLLFLLSTIWAIDRGMAFIGFLKYMPILFCLILLSNKPDAKEKIFNLLPYLAAIITIMSAVLMQFKPLEDLFSVAGRLSGCFQYPNTFALFLLVAELLLIKKEKLKHYHYIILAILLFGILYSGSRTVFVLLVASNFFAAFFTKNKIIKFGILGAICAVLLAVFAAAAFDFGGILTRFANISFKESTFAGRILYFYDALPVILKNPFGLGYRGYYYIQQSIQSGVYSVSAVHNDFLQLMLDIGIIPALVFVAALLKPVFIKRTDNITRIIIIVMFLHSCFDFNLQFIAMVFLYLLFTDFGAGKRVELTSRQTNFAKFAAFLIALVSLYMAVPLTLTNFGFYKTSSRLYPFNTQNETALLTQIEDYDIAFANAEKILKQNEYVTLAYSVKSRYYFSQGDFGELISVKNTTFEKFPFRYSEYEEYCYMLINAINFYSGAGEFESAELCKEELLSVPKRLRETVDRLSPLGRMIKDQPTTALPNDIIDYIAQLEKEND